MITWLIGMSGAGKTTIAERLYGRLKPDCRHLLLLDGDTFRDVLRNDVDHTIEGRRKNAERISNLCRAMDGQGIHVICAVLSIFPEWLAWNRANFSSYYEVFLDIPLPTLEARDTKGLYAGGRSGQIPNVVGLHIPFPRPCNSDLVLGEAEQALGIDACVDAILAQMPKLD
ncbi:adenylyl-sulfate kinase [Magnetospirillum sulfuroxidans]|uniref:Adenylyl-sulfate kinase n=1 Tax=Magnetospirillum sulfuroxidans TaxID=611300 RepID=A0ABS5IH73_9PROT|nr:adenylyl-sulfate kinase [Magnetospirillum sulfuroxidans]MBR9973749.1 adenylyl-sulfate kinase [Magnetospirillum sulfuroxidans]